MTYKEGDWYAVPLPDGDYAIGLVARTTRMILRRAKKGKWFLGYYFGPKHASVPSLEAARQLTPADAVLVSLTADLGIIEGTWIRIGFQSDWDRGLWPMPAFGRYMEGEASVRDQRIEYPSGELDSEPIVRWVSAAEARSLPKEMWRLESAVAKELARRLQ